MNNQGCCYLQAHDDNKLLGCIFSLGILQYCKPKQIPFEESIVASYA